MFTSTLNHKRHDFRDKFAEEDGFQIAIAIMDYWNSATDYHDKYDRPLEEYAIIKI